MFPRSQLQRQDGAQADTSALCIIILAISGYGQLGFPDNSVEVPVKPSTYDPGGLDAISTALVAQVTGQNIEHLEALALTGSHYVKLTWRLHLPRPSFNTRHLLVVAATPVSFAGDISWAQRIVRNAEKFDIIYEPLPPRSPSISIRDRQKTTFSTSQPGTHSQVQAVGWVHDHPEDQRFFSHESRSDMLLSLSPPPEDDNISICSDVTATGTLVPTLHRNPTIFRVLSPPPSRKPSSHDDKVNGKGVDGMVEQQLQLDMFNQKKREAEELYARSGDTSGLLAVLAAATASSRDWQSGETRDF